MTRGFKSRKFLAVFSTACVAVGASAAFLSLQRPSAFSKAPSGKITPWQAMTIAAKRSGGKPFQATFEFEDGKWGYSVMVVRSGALKEVEINSETGAVGDVEAATPAGEASEMKSDLTAALRMGRR